MKTGLGKLQIDLKKSIKQIDTAKLTETLQAKISKKELEEIAKKVKISSQPSSDQFIKKFADIAKKVK